MSEVKTETSEKPPSKLRSLGRPIGLVVVLVIVGLVVKNLIFAAGHESTDNATVTSDVVQVSSQVAGVVQQINFQDNQPVKKGQVLFVLDQSKYKLAVEQAKANLASAVAEARAAGVEVTLASALSSADQVTASGGVAQTAGEIGVARAGVQQANAQWRQAVAAEQSAQREIQNSTIAVDTAKVALDRANLDLQTAQSNLNAANAAVVQATSNVQVSQTAEQQAATEEKRAQDLLTSGVISRQDAERASLTHAQAVGALESANQSLVVARANVRQRQLAVQSAEKSVSLAENQVRQAKVASDDSRTRLQAVRAGTASAKAMVEQSQRSVTIAQGKAQQSAGQQQTANTGPQQVEVKKSAERLALAKVDQAKASLRTAELDLQHTVVVAPVDGRASKRFAQIGLLAQTGSPLVAIVPDHGLYVVANFKETQTAKLRVGQEADIEIDGVPGKTFHGVIDSLAPATGSTFALLPPDNATGNFVKVVQRVPVRIRFKEKDAASSLQAGLSAVVTVAIH